MQVTTITAIAAPCEHTMDSIRPPPEPGTYGDGRGDGTGRTCDSLQVRLFLDRLSMDMEAPTAVIHGTTMSPTKLKHQGPSATDTIAALT